MKHLMIVITKDYAEGKYEIPDVFPNNDSCVMHITDAEEVLEHDLPLCVKDCIRYAWKKGYPWIYFGYEGKEQAGLPTYRSAWDRI